MSAAALHAGPSPPAVWWAEFDDPHAMALAQREAEIEYLSLGDRHYRGEVTLLDFGPFTIQSATDGAHITRGVLRPDRVGVLFGHGPMEATVNGWAGHEAGAVVLGPGADLFCHAPRSLGWMAYSLDEAQCRAWLDGAALPGAGGFTVADSLIAKAPALRQLAAEMAALARRGSGALAGASVARAVQDSVHGALTRGLVEEGGDTRALRQRLRIVAAAEAYLDSRIGQPVYTTDLVAALSVPARTIQKAFSAVYGMGPNRFLQLRRLNLAHAALRRAEGHAALVKTIALDHGFWHFGRFGQDYKRLFGETPSATLARRDSRVWTGFRRAGARTEGY